MGKGGRRKGEERWEEEGGGGGDSGGRVGQDLLQRTQWRGGSGLGGGKKNDGGERNIARKGER